MKDCHTEGPRRDREPNSKNVLKKLPDGMRFELSLDKEKQLMTLAARTAQCADQGNTRGRVAPDHRVDARDIAQRH